MVILEDYFRDIKYYLNNIGEFELRDVSVIQEGDKYISKGPVGGRYYKEYKLEYKNNVQDYEDFENVKNKGNRDIRNITRRIIPMKPILMYVIILRIIDCSNDMKFNNM